MKNITTSWSWKAIYIFFIAVIIISCVKEEQENRDFDTKVSEAVVVNVKTNEIGGNGLKLLSFRDDDSPIYKGSFYTVVSKEGEQLLVVTDSKDELRALTLSTPSTSGSDIMEINAHSTAISVVFISPGILSTDPDESKKIMENIENLTSFKPLETYLKNNLHSKSLESLISTSNYDTLLSACVDEYYETYIISNKKHTKGFIYSNNLVTLTELAQNLLSIKNEGYRYVSVVERDIDKEKNQLETKVHLSDMKGATPFGWGTLFTNTLLSPTTELISYSPANNASYSEFWICGLGRKTKETVPSSVQNLYRPIVETIGYYGAFAIMDLLAGSSKLLGISSVEFKVIMNKLKLEKATYKTVTANTKLGLKIALIDDTFTIISILASMSGTVVAQAAGYVLATVSAAFGAFNFGAFASSILALEDYTKFSVVAYNQAPMFPLLTEPENNSQMVSLPVTFKWVAADRAGSYEIQVSTRNDFSILDFQKADLTVTTTVVSTLKSGTDYYWRMRAKNRYGESCWSEVWKFKTAVIAPIADFICNQRTINAGQSVQFTDQSTNSPTSWSWSFGDGGTSTTKNPSHTYSTAGTYTVRLTATNSAGSDEEIKSNYITVTLPVIAPVAVFSGTPRTIMVGQSVQFTDQSTNSPTSWGWNFGDGGSSTVKSPSHTYNTAGSYTVTLTATNSAGSDVETKNSYITVNPTNTGIIFNPNLTYGSINDVDGNTYKTIQIGTQTWMAENLKTTKYGDGSTIPLVSNYSDWSNLSFGAYSNYNNTSNNVPTYGRLYNWYAVMNSRNLCPTGWHVPSKDEWIILSDYLGGEYTAGGKLKETGLTHWLDRNYGATNESGFTALPGGFRIYDYTAMHYDYGYIGINGYWWSSTQNEGYEAWYYSMSDGNNFLTPFSSQLEWGYSVRCLQGENQPLLTINTKAISNITSTSVTTTGGNVICNGSSSVISRGVCWSTSPSPTISNSFTINGSGDGIFIADITGLSPNTKYYIRAYATSSTGTSYGNQLIITTYNENTISDIEANTYHTVTIGSQVWMVENLKVTKYNNGDNISNVTDNTDWCSLITGAYCDFDNSSTIALTYGKLYNWYAIADNRKICPTGWHVPSNDEWSILINYLGGAENAGGKLKETGTLHWITHNIEATNESGFTALSGSSRNYDGSFGDLRYWGYWWTSTENDSNNAWVSEIGYLWSKVDKFPVLKIGGASVRCIKD